MRKKTSIFLFKLWVCPPIVLIGSYFVVGSTLMAFGLDDEMVQLMHDARDSHRGVIAAVYYCYVVMFFVQMLLNVPFITSVTWFKGGLSQIAGEQMTAEFVRQSPFMFWDEIVDKYSVAQTKAVPPGKH